MNARRDRWRELVDTTRQFRRARRCAVLENWVVAVRASVTFTDQRGRLVRCAADGVDTPPFPDERTGEADKQAGRAMLITRRWSSGISWSWSLAGTTAPMSPTVS